VGLQETFKKIWEEFPCQFPGHRAGWLPGDTIINHGYRELPGISRLKLVQGIRYALPHKELRQTQRKRLNNLYYKRWKKYDDWKR